MPSKHVALVVARLATLTTVFGYIKHFLLVQQRICSLKEALCLGIIQHRDLRTHEACWHVVVIVV